MSGTASKHLGHGNVDIAYHVEWGFRREALRWQNGMPTGVNLHPVGSEFHRWLLRKGQFFVFAEEHAQEVDPYTNPYTYRCSSLATILAEVINDSYSIATSADAIEPIDAEIKRIRIYNEQVLYILRGSARL